MNIKYRRLKGTKDILLQEAERWRWCEERWADVLNRYGYGEIRTPIIEPTGLFQRSVGEDTDIVEKEMYTFATKSGESLTLRPEMTASVVRAYLENGLTRQPGTLKFFYMGPMFRHDRPQAGRQRQFHQIGVEAIGSASPVLDAEVIHTAMALFDAVDARGMTVLVNSIGCPKCRPAFLDRMQTFIEANLDAIPVGLRDRAQANPLRLYDAKDDEVQELLQGLEPITTSLCGDCLDHHKVVVQVLQDLEVPFQEDPTLVRGLDYYGRTTFEITARTGRKQNSLAGGGRYDHLIGQCGGPPTPAVGFSIGIERTLLHLRDEMAEDQALRQTQVDVYVACLGLAAQRYGLTSAELLRGFCRVEVDTSGRAVKAQAKSANLRNARILLIVGDAEVQEQNLQLKILATGEQKSVARNAILATVREVLQI